MASSRSYNQNRREQIALRVSTDEKRQIEANASAAGLAVPDFLRAVATKPISQSPAYLAVANETAVASLTDLQGGIAKALAALQPPTEEETHDDHQDAAGADDAADVR